VCIIRNLRIHGHFKTGLGGQVDAKSKQTGMVKTVLIWKICMQKSPIHWTHQTLWFRNIYPSSLILMHQNQSHNEQLHMGPPSNSAGPLSPSNFSKVAGHAAGCMCDPW